MRKPETKTCVAVSQDDGHGLSRTHNRLTTDPPTTTSQRTLTTISQTAPRPQGSQKHNTFVSNYPALEGPSPSLHDLKTKQCVFQGPDWEKCSRTWGDCYLLPPPSPPAPLCLCDRPGTGLMLRRACVWRENIVLISLSLPAIQPRT